MLSEREKRELLEDSRSLRRRGNFRTVRMEKGRSSLDDYIRFLTSIQAIFGPFALSQARTVTKHNKL
ncbi:MAG: hypothetical protein MJA29_08670 [Candidatus Omnitrophica bacterium]|nr:hypothetical protein [Candidatus Omnitrophota bacterium]